MPSTDSPGAFTEQWQTTHHALMNPGSDLSLPFQPLSFRDFMLYESHVINASRGLARRFMPGAYRLASAYEKLSGKTFPKFRPHPLWYQQPIYYMGNHLAFVPSGVDVNPPAYTSALDYELELGFVLARPLKNASVEAAVDAIGAFVLLNDFSARDIQLPEMRSGFGPQKSKHFLSSMAANTVDARTLLPRLDNLEGAVLINDRQVATVTTAGMQYSLGEVLAHVSRDEQLFPGELFGTGTLPGGSGMENGHWLNAGDTLTLTLSGVGDITHKIL
ncbi:fumarylacetoacetate hydrolase family protein [Marinobacter confluentis]|uniref:Fumarylacetoacetate hydrolase family protein n=1 Tax=Marinobacter confluentis TaxID=1697557 RepID=A0A4Z1BLF7_9GAMM|nr:fumarylacetoacetate hydrolase family protein [Marinobacter confluentis]TGN40667.1 fumarylacetoacetate hydrolase family protein [Marinobacter confluentis]